MDSHLEKASRTQCRSLLETPSSGEVFRLFVAIPLWDEFRAMAYGHLDELMRHRWPLRWVKPENWHITLQFLGDVSAVRIPNLSEALRESVGGHVPFEIELGEIGGFPRVSKARVLWVGVKQGRDALLDLAKDVREGCVAGGCPGDRKPFEAHLTLARAKEIPVNIQLPSETCKAKWGTHTVDHIALVRSHLQKGGPVYEPIARFPLSR